MRGAFYTIRQGWDRGKKLNHIIDTESKCGSGCGTMNRLYAVQINNKINGRANVAIRNVYINTYC